MKFFKNRYRINVSTNPDTIVPKIESSGFFTNFPSSTEPKFTSNYSASMLPRLA